MITQAAIKAMRENYPEFKMLPDNDMAESVRKLEYSDLSPEDFSNRLNSKFPMSMTELTSPMLSGQKAAGPSITDPHQGQAIPKFASALPDVTEPTGDPRGILGTAKDTAKLLGTAAVEVPKTVVTEIAKDAISPFEASARLGGAARLAVEGRGEEAKQAFEGVKEVAPRAGAAVGSYLIGEGVGGALARAGKGVIERAAVEGATTGGAYNFITSAMEGKSPQETALQTGIGTVGGAAVGAGLAKLLHRVPTTPFASRVTGAGAERLGYVEPNVVTLGDAIGEVRPITAPGTAAEAVDPSLRGLNREAGFVGPADPNTPTYLPAQGLEPNAPVVPATGAGAVEPNLAGTREGLPEVTPSDMEGRFPGATPGPAPERPIEPTALQRQFIQSEPFENTPQPAKVQGIERIIDEVMPQRQPTAPSTEVREPSVRKLPDLRITRLRDQPLLDAVKPEYIVAPAVKYKGSDYTGPNHAEIYDALDILGKPKKEALAVDGFVTSKGRFLTRSEADRLGKVQTSEDLDFNDYVRGQMGQRGDVGRVRLTEGSVRTGRKADLSSPIWGFVVDPLTDDAVAVIGREGDNYIARAADGEEVTIPATATNNSTLQGPDPTIPLPAGGTGKSDPNAKSWGLTVTKDGNVLDVIGAKGDNYIVRDANKNVSEVMKSETMDPTITAKSKKLDMHVAARQLGDAAKKRIASRKGRLGAGQDLLLDVADHAMVVASKLLEEGTNPKNIAAIKKMLATEYKVPLKQIQEIIEKGQKYAENFLKDIVGNKSKYPKTERLLSLMEQGKATPDWYQPAWEELQNVFGPDAKLVANLIAATSPRMPVERNIDAALQAYVEHKLGQKFTNKFPAHMSNILKATRGQEITAPKIGPFAKALMGDPDAIVIDTWMSKLFGFTEKPTPAQMRLIQQKIRDLSRKSGVTPAVIQERLWKAYRQEVQGKAADVRSPAEMLRGTSQHRLL